MTRIISCLTLGVCLLLAGCQTVATDREDRPWWHPTLDPAAVPCPLPTGGFWFSNDLAMPDYHNAHGAGWWDVPWVCAEQIVMMPTYLLWAIGETTYTELLGGGYDYDRGEWQWWTVNGLLGLPHAALSSVSLAAVTVVDTVGHDPIAAIIWALKSEGQAKD